MGVLFLFEFLSQNPLGIGKVRNLVLSGLTLSAYIFIFSGRKYFSAFILLFGIILFPIYLQMFGSGKEYSLPRNLLTEAIYWTVSLAILLNCILFFLASLKSLIQRRSVGGSKICAFFIWFFLIFSTLLTVFYGEYFIVSDSILSATTLLAIAQTNLSEGLSYLKDNFLHPRSILLSLAFICVLFSFLLYVYKSHTQAKLTTYSKSNPLLLSLIIVLSLFLLYKTSSNYITEPFYGLKNGLDSYVQFKEQSAKRAALLGDEKCQDSGFPGLYILVLGESQSKRHMGAYGYKRNTTPWLSSLKDSNNLVLFEQVFSNHTHTVPTLTYALTAKSQYDNSVLENSPSILDVAKCAGFSTYWVSNQLKYGAWDTPITVISSSADEQFFINQNLGYSTNSTFFDENLVDELYKIKNIPRKTLVVVHLMGSHSAYADRYPKSFSLWGNSKKIDTYDNSISYTDFVLKNIYDWAAKQPNFMAMIYLSDHADAVDKNLSHDSSQFDWSMTEIPMFIKFSNSYVKEHARLLHALKQNRSKPFTNDMLYDSMLSILGIKSLFYNQANDITRPQYHGDLKKLYTLHGVRSFQDYGK